MRGAGARRVLADLMALVRHAVRPESDLAPYPEQVRARYERWLAQQEAAGKQFSPAQRWWLDQIADHIGVNLSIAPSDLSGGAFICRGGPLGAQRTLGDGWQTLLEELNEELAA